MDIDLFLVSRKVEESLLRREIGPCLAWCYENKSKLRKFKVGTLYTVENLGNLNLKFMENFDHQDFHAVVQSCGFVIHCTFIHIFGCMYMYIKCIQSRHYTDFSIFWSLDIEQVWLNLIRSRELLYLHGHIQCTCTVLGPVAQSMDNAIHHIMYM